MGVNAVLDQLELGDHVCCPISGPAQTWAVAAATTACGLRDGHKMLFFVDDPDGLRQFLATTVPGAERAVVHHQVQIHPGAGTYLGDTGFDPDRVFDMWVAEIDLADHQGFAGVRATGDIRPATPRRRPNIDAVIEYEHRLNTIFTQRRVIGICHCDPGGFTPATWQRILAVHPTTVLPTGDGTLARLHSACTATGIRLTGTVDLLNQDALPGVLTEVAALPGACRIDAKGLEFVNAHAIGCLLQTAAARTGRPTTIVCRPHLAKVLKLCGSASIPGLVVTTESP